MGRNVGATLGSTAAYLGPNQLLNWIRRAARTVMPVFGSGQRQDRRRGAGVGRPGTRGALKHASPAQPAHAHRRPRKHGVVPGRRPDPPPPLPVPGRRRSNGAWKGRAAGRPCRRGPPRLRARRAESGSDSSACAHAQHACLHACWACRVLPGGHSPSPALRHPLPAPSPAAMGLVTFMSPRMNWK